MTDRLLRLRDVLFLTGLGKSTIYRKIANDTFPQPVSIGVSTVRWRESDIRAWITALTTRTV